MINKYIALLVSLVLIISTTTNTTEAQSNEPEPSSVDDIAIIVDAITPTILTDSPDPIEIVVSESLVEKQEREERERIARLPKPKPKIKPKQIKTVVFSQSTEYSQPANYCSCVNYVKSRLGMTGSIGMARNWPTNSKEPHIGGVVVTYESGAGHVALIIGLEGDNLVLDEANYSRCRHTSGRRLNKHSGVIKGFYN